MTGWTQFVHGATVGATICFSAVAMSTAMGAGSPLAVTTVLMIISMLLTILTKSLA